VLFELPSLELAVPDDQPVLVIAPSDQLLRDDLDRDESQALRIRRPLQCGGEDRLPKVVLRGDPDQRGRLTLQPLEVDVDRPERFHG
jgi:hypothetical protein